MLAEKESGMHLKDLLTVTHSRKQACITCQSNEELAERKMWLQTKGLAIVRAFRSRLVVLTKQTTTKLKRCIRVQLQRG